MIINERVNVGYAHTPMKNILYLALKLYMAGAVPIVNPTLQNTLEYRVEEEGSDCALVSLCDGSDCWDILYCGEIDEPEEVQTKEYLSFLSSSTSNYGR